MTLQERLRTASGPFIVSGLGWDAATRIDALEAELEALRADAARYRKLRTYIVAVDVKGDEWVGTKSGLDDLVSRLPGNS